MLGKLFKHEFKSVSKMGGLLLLIATGVSLLGMAYLFSPLWKNFFVSEPDADPMYTVLGAILGIAGLLTYAIMLIGVSFGLQIFLGVRYYRSMFAEEGYLTHTLPVKSVDVLISKFITAGIWLLITNLVLYLLVLLLVVTGVSTASGIGIADLFSDFSRFLEALNELMTEELKTSFVSSGVVFLLTILIGPFTNAAILFGALTIGHYSRKNKGLMGILAFFGVRFAMSIVNGIINVALTMAAMANYQDESVQMVMANGKYLVNLVVSILFGVGLFFWARHIVERRLNME